MVFEILQTPKSLTSQSWLILSYPKCTDYCWYYVLDTLKQLTPKNTTSPNSSTLPPLFRPVLPSTPKHVGHKTSCPETCWFRETDQPNSVDDRQRISPMAWNNPFRSRWTLLGNFWVFLDSTFSIYSRSFLQRVLKLISYSSILFFSFIWSFFSQRD